MRNYLMQSNKSLFDEMFDDFFKPMFYQEKLNGVMATDVKKSNKGYELEIDVPGFNKSDISIDFEKGYLTISAKKQSAQEENGESKYLSRERVSAIRRSFYVGNIDEEKITAKYENGVLIVDLPKKDPVIESAKKITVE